jgi:hypothetical protein
MRVAAPTGPLGCPIDHGERLPVPRWAARRYLAPSGPRPFLAIGTSAFALSMLRAKGVPNTE